MIQEPDYTTYSLSDLYFIQGHIDAHMYPERAATVEREIQRRLALQPAQGALNRSVSARPPLSRVAVGTFLVVSGGMSLAYVFDGGVRASGLSLYVAYSLPVILYGAMVAAGWLLLKRQRLGLWLGLWVMALQLPIVQVGHLTYMATSFPTLELKLWPLLGFAQSLSLGLKLHWLPSPQPLYLGVNMSACVAIVPLAYHIERHELAVQRLRRSMGAG